MFTYRSKTLLAGLIFEFVVLLNFVSFYIFNYKIIPISMILIGFSFLIGVISFLKLNTKYAKLNFLLSMIFIPFSGIFSIVFIMLSILLFIGFIRQDKKLKEDINE